MLLFVPGKFLVKCVISQTCGIRMSLRRCYQAPLDSSVEKLLSSDICKFNLLPLKLQRLCTQIEARMVEMEDEDMIVDA